MAFNTKYRFRFLSDNGVSYEIRILQDGYSGSVYDRSLGSTPVLRRDNNDHISGTSLTIPAECYRDEEFAELYTSDPRQYQVTLKAGSTMIWQGFVSPELYSEPDIAPPYDVTITAVDGLGELKRSSYGRHGLMTISAILDMILAKTGLSLPKNLINTINAVKPTAIASKDILSVKVDMDHMAEESCYDVLQMLMRTMNATITQMGDSWLIARTNDISLLSTSITAYKDGGTTVSYPVRQFGSMKSYKWWPVGNLSSEIIPARKKVTLVADNHYKESVFTNSDMTENAGWTTKGNASHIADDNSYSLPSGGSIEQTITFGEEVGYRLLLSISARNVGEGEDSSDLTVEVTMKGRVNASASATYYLIKGESSRRNIAQYVWRTTQGSIPVTLEAPLDSDTAEDAQTSDIVIPLYYSSSRSYAYASSITVKITNGSGTYPQRVYGVHLQKYEQSKGYRDVLTIGNQAREDKDEIDIAFGISTIAARQFFMRAIALNSSDKGITSWSSSKFSNLDYMQLMARDYAVGVALPLLQKRGKLNVPSDEATWPLIFREKDGTTYWPRTISWDLIPDEMDLDLVSLPTATISVEKEEVVEVANESATAGSGSPSSGGGSGGSGGGGTTGATALSELTDVSLTNVQDGEVLSRSGDKWVNSNLELLLNPLISSLVNRIAELESYFTKVGGTVRTSFNISSAGEVSAGSAAIAMAVAEPASLVNVIEVSAVWLGDAPQTISASDMESYGITAGVVNDILMGAVNTIRNTYSGLTRVYSAYATSMPDGSTELILTYGGIMITYTQRVEGGLWYVTMTGA